MNTDYYKILGVEKSASEKDVKMAFRKLAHKHHPDKGGDEKKFKEINKAYQVLSNKEKRSQYDKFGSSASNFSGTSGFNGAGFGQGGFNVNYADFAKKSNSQQFKRFSLKKIPILVWIFLLPIIIAISLMGLVVIFFLISLKALQSVTVKR